MVVAGALLMTPTTMHAWDTNTVFDRRPRKTTVRFATQPFLQDSHHEHQGPPCAATDGNLAHSQFHNWRRRSILRMALCSS
jgi:hypothetical protein